MRYEQAVVREADRGNYWQLVESLLVEEKMPPPRTPRARAKGQGGFRDIGLTLSLPFSTVLLNKYEGWNLTNTHH